MKQTQACTSTYYYIWNIGNCNINHSGYYWGTTYNYATKSNLADQEYYPFGAYDSDHTKYISMPRSYTDGYWYCRCYEYATLYYLDESTNDNGWVNISSNYNSYFSWLTYFQTSTDSNTGRLTILTSSQSVTQTVRFKVSIYSTPIYTSWGANGATNEWEFDVTVYKACIDNYLT